MPRLSYVNLDFFFYFRVWLTASIQCYSGLSFYVHKYFLPSWNARFVTANSLSISMTDWGILDRDYSVSVNVSASFYALHKIIHRVSHQIVNNLLDIRSVPRLNLFRIQKIVLKTSLLGLGRICSSFILPAPDQLLVLQMNWFEVPDKETFARCHFGNQLYSHLSHLVRQMFVMHRHGRITNSVKYVREWLWMTL